MDTISLKGLESLFDSQMPRQRAGFCPRRREKGSDDFSRDKGLAKTKLCKYHILGQCVKGGGCQFAHDVSEIKSTPGAAHAKVCRNLINTGRCDEIGCPYVHNKEQLLEKSVNVSASRLDQASRLCFATFASDTSASRSQGVGRQIPTPEDRTPRLSLDASLPAPSAQQLQTQLSCDVDALWQTKVQGLVEPPPQPHPCARPQSSLIQAAQAVTHRWMARLSGPVPAPATQPQPILQPLILSKWSWPDECEDLDGGSTRCSEDASDDVPEDAASKMTVVVKNTFINVVLPDMQANEQRRRRSLSASPRLSDATDFE